MEFGSRVSLMMYVARVESRRRHHGVGGSLCGAQPTPVWPCKQPSTVRCPQTASVRISIRQCIALTDAFDRNRNPWSWFRHDTQLNALAVHTNHPTKYLECQQTFIHNKDHKKQQKSAKLTPVWRQAVIKRIELIRTLCKQQEQQQQWCWSRIPYCI